MDTSERGLAPSHTTGSLTRGNMVLPRMVATGWGSSGSSLGCVLDTQSGIARCTPGGLGGALLDFPSYACNG